MQRKTKIVATLGPSSSSAESIKQLIIAGVNVFRLNFSHGTAEEHIARSQLIKSLALELKSPVGILCDLQGPKIRIGRFESGKVILRHGDVFTLNPKCELGDQSQVGLDYKNLPDEVNPGNTLLLDDGRIVFDVISTDNNRILCKVITGGTLSNNKGINLKGGGLAADALTDKDVRDIQTAAEIGADFLAVSFVKTPVDIMRARSYLHGFGGKADIISKIERAEAIDNLESIIEHSDAIMVARGDLGVEVGDAAVPGLQKKMIRLAREKNKAIITATQMLESMINSPIPTRAEVSDVANAVLDGTDAVMLSAETAAGKFPIDAVEAMHRVCIKAEIEYQNQNKFNTRNIIFDRIDETIASSAVYASSHFGIKGIIALTTSGNSARWISRADCIPPIIALSPDESTRGKLTLLRNVYPFYLDDKNKSREEILSELQPLLTTNTCINNGDKILITFGEPFGTMGGTNSLIIKTL